MAGNLEKTTLSLYETEWRERGYGLRRNESRIILPIHAKTTYFFDPPVRRDLERVGPSRRRWSAARLRIGDDRVAVAGEVE